MKPRAGPLKPLLKLSKKKKRHRFSTSRLESTDIKRAKKDT